VDGFEQKLEQACKRGRPHAGWVVEPVVQGVAGMVVQPQGWLQRVVRLARQASIPLIADEVMTGFGRTGPFLLPMVKAFNLISFAWQKA
jgi:adenosylmethionine-8-amino-7-oxononanoate aminotransferase